MPAYELIRLARESAAQTQLPYYPRALVLALAEQLETAVTKLRDQQWDYEWKQKQQINQSNITTV